MVRTAITVRNSNQNPQDEYNKAHGLLATATTPNQDLQDVPATNDDSLGRKECNNGDENNKESPVSRTKPNPLSTVMTKINKTSTLSASETNPLPSFAPKKVLPDMSKNAKPVLTPEPPIDPDDDCLDGEIETDILSKNSRLGMTNNHGLANIENVLTNEYSGLSTKQIRKTLRK